MDPAASAVLAVMAILLIKHFLFDFVLQGPAQLRHKAQYGHPFGLLHAGLQAAGSLPAFLVVAPSAAVAAAIVAGEFAVHYHLDWGKEQLLRRTGWSYGDSRYWAVFGADQMIHGLTYVTIGGVLAAGL